MGRTTLDQFIKDYAELSVKEDEIKVQKESLKAAIIKEMGNEMKYDNGEHSVTRSLAEGFKYKDEVGMIKLLKNNGYKSYIKEKIDTTTFNKFMKENATMPIVENLINNNYCSKTLTEKLVVK